MFNSRFSPVSNRCAKPIAGESECRTSANVELLNAREVMKMLGYQTRAGFWTFVHRHGVPHVRLNARKVLFSRVALEDWLAHRSSNC